MTKLPILYFLVLIYLLQVETSHPDRICPKLSLKNGRVRYRQKGRFVKFLCNVGFIIAGEKYSTCHNGAWDSEIPKCVRNNCKKLNPPANGMIYPSHRGAVSNFFCKPDFVLHGPNVTYCDGRAWDEKLPTCLPTNTKPPLSCDFESEDLCGWNNDVGHDFDWRRANLKTPSGHLGTGPSFDHTKGAGNSGYYMYIEASSRSVNDTARLISPIYDKTNESNVCLEFYYHMYGSSTGQLRAYIKKLSESWDLLPGSAIFWRAGNHGDRWLRSLHQIGPIEEDFQIIFEGVRGESYFSDIAIDDVKIIQDCLSYITTESSRETVQTTENYPVFESCRNRCNKESVTPQPDVIACNCTDDCADYNSCCPDYLTECVIDNWDGDDFTILEESSVNDETTPYLNKITHFIERETTVVAFSTTKLSTEGKLTTMDIRTRAPTTTIKTTTTLATPPATTTVITKTSTTKTPRKLFTKARKEEDIKEHILNIKTPRPPVRTTSEPVNKHHDKKPLFISTTENPTTRKIVKEYIHDTKTPEVIQAKHGFNIKILIIVVASLGSIMFLIVSSIYLGKHCSHFKCRNVSKMTKHYGSDSQSDVRFLTSDEILNFNLAMPDDN